MTAPDITNPAGEFAALPFDVQQSLLTLWATAELMLPEERLAAANTHLGVVQALEAMDVLPLTRLAHNEMGALLTMADREERAADERSR